MLKIKLKAARVNKGLTQKQVANAIGRSASTIKNWENGTSFPKQPDIEKVCDLYGIPYDGIDFSTT